MTQYYMEDNVSGYEHRWFSWYPVKINAKWYWFKYVTRTRKYWHGGPYGVTGYWVYDVLS